MRIELKLQLRRHVGDAKSARSGKNNPAALSLNARMIVVACKRNAAVRNIAFGSDGTFHLVKSAKVGKMQIPERCNAATNQ
jgi:hypothetical protein